MKTTRAERHAALLASLTLLGCRDALQPVGPRVPAPSAAIEPAPPPATNECASPPVGTIWCDDFEVDRLSSYFEHLSPTTFARTAGVGAGGSYGMRAVYTPGVPQAGDLKLAFGRSPDPDYMKPVGYGAPAYREIYWRAYLRAQPGWTGGGGGAFTRAMVLASAAWAQAAVGHVYASDGDALSLDPVRGTDEVGTLVTTGYNDVDHFTWLGQVAGTAPIFGGGAVGEWYCIEAHMKLNDPGKANGVLEYWINGTLDAQRTGLNFVGSYSAFGINAIFFENYWGATAPQTQERYWDNIVVGDQRSGCGTSTSYSIIDLGTLGPTSASGDAPQSNAFAVNARGQVVGASALPTGAHPFLWENGAMRDLGTLGGMFASAAHINDRGQVVGSSSTTPGYPGYPQRAFLWQDGVMQELPTLRGGNSSATRINEAGQILGRSDGEGVLWDNGAIVPLGFDARALNDRGQVIGDLKTGSTVHAVLWQAGVVTDLGTLEGGDSSWARAISNSGWVVGASRTVSGAVHAVRWGGGQITDLGVLPGDSRAFGLYVNNGGEVAGQSYGGGYEHAFEWDHGVMRAPAAASLGDYATGINASGLVTVVSRVAYTWRRSLLTQLPTLPGGETHAGTYAVNNAGWIVGWALPPHSAGYTHAVLWVPSGGAAQMTSVR